MKIYVMPDGTKRQYDDGKAPEGAKLVVKAEPKTETKSVAPEDKSVEPENKSIPTVKTKARGRKK